MSLQRLLNEHPASVGETYGEHCKHAAGFGFSMIFGGIACLLHAMFPWVFVCTGSKVITRLHDRMVVNRHRLSAMLNEQARAAQPENKLPQQLTQSLR